MIRQRYRHKQLSKWNKKNYSRNLYHIVFTYTHKILIHVCVCVFFLKLYNDRHATHCSFHLNRFTWIKNVIKMFNNDYDNWWDMRSTILFLSTIRKTTGFNCPLLYTNSSILDLFFIIHNKLVTFKDG